MTRPHLSPDAGRATDFYRRKTMSSDADTGSRRRFLTDVGRLAGTAALVGCAPPVAAASAQNTPSPGSPDWDLRWLDTLRPATDRAVFDWPSLGDPADPIVLEIAERYLDNCRSAYRERTHT